MTLSTQRAGNKDGSGVSPERDLGRFGALVPLPGLRRRQHHATLLFCGLLLAGAPSVGAPAPAQLATFHVSPAGSDEADGSSPGTPFRTLERAAQALASTGGGTVYLMGGSYHRTEPLLLHAGAGSQKWLAFPGADPVLDGDRKASEGILVQASNVTIDGLTLRDFMRSGIVVSGGGHVTISNNRIEETHSNDWTQAAILALQQAPDLTVVGNIIDGADYSGIQLAASQAGDLSRPTVRENIVNDVCRRVADCGAIYVTGRTQTSQGATLEGNSIDGYGTVDRLSFAIYLDDFASGATVWNNRIRGSGTGAIHIHGGRDNLIEQNDIEVRAGQVAVRLTPEPDSPAMTGNQFRRNTIRSERPLADLVPPAGHGPLLLTSDNRVVKAR